MPAEDAREPALHATAEASFVVGEADLASALSRDPAEPFPPVLATSRLVAFMELAAARLLTPLLHPGELSVGVTIETSHTAATPLGSTVRATARYLGRAGKLYAFEVAAFDEAGEIGRGAHRRAIISEERLLKGAARRKP